MQDEHLDDIINQAANQHHPPYNDKAWDAMQAKLDAQLPQKDNRKKLLWFFFALLLVGGGAFYAGSYYSKNKTAATDAVAQQKDNLNQVAALPATKNANVQTGTNDKTEQAAATATILQQQENKLAPKIISAKNNSLGNPVRSKVKGKIRVSIQPAFATDGDSENPVMENKTAVTANMPVIEKATDNTAATVITATSEVENVVTKNEEQSPLDKAKEKTIIAEEKTAVAPNKKKTKAGFLSSFGFTFSAGPDRSFVKDNSPGKTTGTYGAGLTYSIGKKITIATGFYVSKKIYTADSAYYKVPAGFFPHYFRVNSIDADCKVYEIPVNITYNFAAGNKHNWFAGIGLSSYLMKKEIYNYDYKYGSFPMIYHKEYVVNNDNKHWFSVLTLSGGYEYKINKTVSFSGAPYIKMPLGGVGFGKVNLSSAGILFTATIKPFAQKK